MSPKYRGDEEDWLDSEAPRELRKKNLKKTTREWEPLKRESLNATVVEIFPKQAAVLLDETKIETFNSGEEPPTRLCSYRMNTLAPPATEGRRERAPVAVGDRVRVEGDVLVGRGERANELVRHAPDRGDDMVHVIASNLHRLVIVGAACEPDFNPGIIDRFLVAASAQSIEPIIVVNKCDLFEGVVRPWFFYEELGVKVFEVSAKRGDGVASLRAELHGRAVAFCGHSGVGKTSLLRSLLANNDYGRVGDVSSFTGKGRHTTTGAHMVSLLEGSRWIDTPGVREFGIVGVSPRALIEHFSELALASRDCAVPGCEHLEESGCAVRDLPRYGSYCRIRSSLEEAEIR